LLGEQVLQIAPELNDVPEVPPPHIGGGGGGALVVEMVETQCFAPELGTAPVK